MTDNTSVNGRAVRLASAAALAGLALLVGLVPALSSAPDDLPRVVWNDNDQPAGTLENGVLSLEIEAVRAEWRYLGPDGPGVEIIAFRERGEAPRNPGPLVRVPRGTRVEASIRNLLEDTLVVHGLSSRGAEGPDSLVVPPGEVRAARFVADTDGTWYYWGTTAGLDLNERLYEDSQLHGVMVVDPPGSAAPADEIMVLSIWFAGPDSTGEPDFGSETFAINGRPWPLTERLQYDVGDSVRWRVLNLTERPHPMHLHGFYFEVWAKGDNHRETRFAPVERRTAVTEVLLVGETARLAWTPERPGGWVFHCHIGYHVVANAAPGEYAGGRERDEALLGGHGHGDPNDHVVKGMGGLMMGIDVRAPEGWRPDTRERRRLRLLVQSDSTPGERRRFGYVLAQPGQDPPADTVTWPGPTLVARVGEPTAVTVVNRTGEPTQVHWHGLEIESYYDGVAGVGGYPGKLTPAILPGDSFTMRITPPRAGSYMYHTHINDIRQQSAGLYGAFIVLEPDQAWEPEVDRVFLASTDSDEEMRPLLNGSAEPDTLVLPAGREVRFRLMNITLFNGGLRFRLVGPNGYPVAWRGVAKDGATLPAYQRRLAHADQVVSVGETFDFVFTPRAGAELLLEMRAFGGAPFVSQVIRVELPSAN